MMKGGAQSQQEIVSDTHRLEHDKRRGKKGECREGGEEGRGGGGGRGRERGRGGGR